MAIIATSSRRRVAMAVLLGLAATGAVIRTFAPDPSVLRDVGTLMLVLWLPAVGNLVAYLVRKMPRMPQVKLVPRQANFPGGMTFAPQLRALVDAPAVPADVLAALEPDERKCTVLVGTQGFTARLAQPLKQIFAVAGQKTLELELLHPKVALPQLVEGVEFHLVAGATGIAKGRVTANRTH